MQRNRETHWQFVCPECGMGYIELGELAAEEIYCVVCIEEAGRHVMLHRWLMVSETVDQTDLRAGLAAA